MTAMKTRNIFVFKSVKVENKYAYSLTLDLQCILLQNPTIISRHLSQNPSPRNHNLGVEWRMVLPDPCTKNLKELHSCNFLASPSNCLNHEKHIQSAHVHSLAPESPTARAQIFWWLGLVGRSGHRVCGEGQAWLSNGLLAL